MPHITDWDVESACSYRALYSSPRNAERIDSSLEPNGAAASNEAGGGLLASSPFGLRGGLDGSAELDVKPKDARASRSSNVRPQAMARPDENPGPFGSWGRSTGGASGLEAGCGRERRPIEPR